MPVSSGVVDGSKCAAVLCVKHTISSILLGLSPDHPSVPAQPDDYVPSDDTLDAITTP
jgi:hypothetical protein